MPPREFQVPITRDVTATAQVRVIANNPAHAVQLAELLAHAAPEKLKFELDDCMGGHPYYAGDEDFDDVEEIPHG